jgi:cytidyltransferase-like protein
MKTIVVVTGGFDPLHSGHIAYFESAKKLGDILLVGVNSDAWLSRKKGRSFMPVSERVNIIKHLKMVDHTVLFDDSDGSAKEAIRNARLLYPDDKIIFANGGDRTKENIPEMDSGVDNIEFVFGVGGEDKKNSSSWILEDYKAPKTIRNWGYYRVLHEVHGPLEPTMVVKELTVDPGKSLSMQYHNYRNEYWIVSEGIATLKRNDSNDVVIMHKHENTTINKKEWHQLSNETTEPLRVVEIQYGDICIEEDIIRS